MSDVWASFAAAEDTVVVASGVANAWYFGRGARGALPGARARRLAGVLLTMLSGGAAAVALVLLAGDRAEGWAGVLARAPLALGSAATFLLVVVGRRQ